MDYGLKYLCLSKREGLHEKKKKKMLKQIPIIHDFFSNVNPLKSMIPTVLGLTLSKCRWVSGP